MGLIVRRIWKALGSFDIKYKSGIVIKGQVLASVVVEFTSTTDLGMGIST